MRPKLRHAANLAASRLSHACVIEADKTISDSDLELATTPQLPNTPPFPLSRALQNIRHVFRLELLPGRPEWSSRRASAIQLISKSARPATTSATGLHEPQSHRLWPTSSSAAKLHRISYAATADWLPTATADATAANRISRPAAAIQQCSSTAATELPNRRSANAPDSPAVPESSSAAASCGPCPEAPAYWLRSDGR